MAVPSKPTKMAVAIIGVTLVASVSGFSQTGAGTAIVTGDAAACARAISVQIWALTRNDTSPQTGPVERYSIQTWLSPTGGLLSVRLSFVTARTGDGLCPSTFGLPTAGEYVAVIVAPDGSGGSQPFRISPDAVATVVIPAPEVTLSGQVHRGDVSVRTHLRVTAFPFSRPPVVLPTDAEGRFQVVLDRPGLHRIEAVGVGVVESELEAGPNVLNIRPDDGPRPAPPPPPPPPPSPRP